MTSKEVTLTKEQQDNVVRWIARSYDVQEVEFLQLSRNTSTAMYLLSVRINGDETLETTIPADSLSKFDGNDGEVLSGPTNIFQKILKDNRVNKTVEIDISTVIITYLEE